MKKEFLLVALVTVLAGCSRKPEAQMQDAFQDSAPPQAKSLANDALKAFEQKDYPKAVLNLQTLRSDPAISADQLTAVQDMMAKVQMDLANRAEQGDKQAQQALQMLQTMPRR